MITTNEARRQLCAVLKDKPQYYVSASKLAVWHSGKNHERYSIGVQPGFDGTPCQVFDGESMNDVLAAAMNAATDSDKSTAEE